MRIHFFVIQSYVLDVNLAVEIQKKKLHAHNTNNTHVEEEHIDYSILTFSLILFYKTDLYIKFVWNAQDNHVLFIRVGQALACSPLCRKSESLEWFTFLSFPDLSVATDADR